MFLTNSRNLLDAKAIVKYFQMVEIYVQDVFVGLELISKEKLPISS
jgi:hypothetical protein